MGVQRKYTEIYSGKIGWKGFSDATIAAYILQGLYTDGAALVVADGGIVSDRLYIGWLNYILDENFPRLNVDIWRAFELANRKELRNRESDSVWIDMMGDGSSLDSGMEVFYVRSGDGNFFDMDEQQEEDSDSWDFDGYDGLKKTGDYVFRQKQILRKYRETSTLSQEEQVDFLLEMFRKFFETGEIRIKEAEYNDRLLVSLRRLDGGKRNRTERFRRYGRKSCFI